MFLVSIHYVFRLSFEFQETSQRSITDVKESTTFEVLKAMNLQILQNTP